MDKKIKPDKVDYLALVNSNVSKEIIKENVHSKLLAKMKNEFTEEQQKWYIANMYMYLHYHPTKEYPIDLDAIWKMLGFSNKGNAKNCLKNNFIEKKDFHVLLLPTQKQVHGGTNKETVMLNTDTFKNLCMVAKTIAGRDIREYYVKLEQINNEIVKDDLALEKQKFIKLESDSVTKIIREKELERQKTLIQKYDKKEHLIYIARVFSYDDGTYVVKIGESRKGIEGRISDHQKSYGKDVILLDCFCVYKSLDFEQYLHHHTEISPNIVKNLPGHETEIELFLIGKHLSYSRLLSIIDENIERYIDPTNLKHENDLLNQKLDLCQSNETVRNELAQRKHEETTLTKLMELIINRMDKLERATEELSTNIKSLQQKTTSNFGAPLATLGDRVQKLNHETLQLIITYDSVADCVKNNPTFNRAGLSKAIMENTVYKNYRWAYQERTCDPNIVSSNVAETKVTKKAATLGYIAKIDEKKTKIVNVFLNRKTASLENGFPSPASLDEPVKKQTLKNGYYYKLYDNCDEILKKDFVKRNNGKEPILYDNGIGKYDEDGVLIEEFTSKDSCIKLTGISNKTIIKAIDKKLKYSGFYFRYIGGKKKCLDF